MSFFTDNYHDAKQKFDLLVDDLSSIESDSHNSPLPKKRKRKSRELLGNTAKKKSVSPKLQKRPELNENPGESIEKPIKMTVENPREMTEEIPASIPQDESEKGLLFSELKDKIKEGTPLPVHPNQVLTDVEIVKTQDGKEMIAITVPDMEPMLVDPKDWDDVFGNDKSNVQDHCGEKTSKVLLPVTKSVLPKANELNEDSTEEFEAPNDNVDCVQESFEDNPNSNLSLKVLEVSKNSDKSMESSIQSSVIDDDTYDKDFIPPRRSRSGSESSTAGKQTTFCEKISSN